MSKAREISELGDTVSVDGSGNLLVGAATAYGDGLTIEQTGLTYIQRNNTGFVVNRTGSDGEIAVFQKDGTNVGKMGTLAGQLAIMGGNGGLWIADGLITPINSAYGLSAGTDIGHSTYNFKDLYLSGSIYQGYSASGYIPLTTVRHCDNGGGAVLFPTHVANKAQMGTLYAYDTSNNNWCVYALKKNDGGSTISVQLLAGTGLTIVATNAFGTIAMSNDTSAVKMIVQIYVVEN